MNLADYPNKGRGPEGYFAFLRERYQILLRRRMGLSAPWTADPVLQTWRFCNVRREDDKVTIWFRENIRDPLDGHSFVFFATIAFRWFNTIVAGEAMRPWLLGPWDRKQAQRALEQRMKAGEKIFTGAYIIRSLGGKPKHVDILNRLSWVLKHASCPKGVQTMRELYEYVRAIPFQGSFTAYQVVVDLQYTHLLRNAPDLNTFTVAGPGCARGLGLMVADDPERFSYYNAKDQAAMLGRMIDMLELSRDPDFWPKKWPQFVLSDIENGFCEYSKWRTGHAGSRLKRRYQ